MNVLKRYCFLIIMTLYAGIAECPYDVWKKEKSKNTSKKKKKILEDN